MQSAHASQLFQTSSSLATGKRRAAKASGSAAKRGRPIYLGRRQKDVEDLKLGGAGSDAGREKVLDALVDAGGRVWTAESGGVVRGTDLRTGRTTHLLLAHKAPVCSLALISPTLLASAGWDKVIHFWPISPTPSTSNGNTSTSAPHRPQPLYTISNASEDFIKALHYLPSQQVLLSGGADRSVRAWRLAGLDSALQTRSAGTLSGSHTRGITSITSLARIEGQQGGGGNEVVYTADSMGRILEVQLDCSGDDRVRFEVLRELRGPETSVAQLVGCWELLHEDEDEDDEENAARAGPSRRPAYIWAASNDKTAQRFDVVAPVAKAGATKGAPQPRHERSSNTGALLGRLPPLAPSVILSHPDYVKTVLPLPQDAGARCAHVVVTGSADEDLRVWRLAGEEVGAEQQLVRRQRGHWHEVEKVLLWHGIVDEDEGEEGKEACSASVASWWVISAGLDGSIRRWRLDELLVAGGEEEEDEDKVEEREGKQANGSENKRPAATGMTAEEEAELAELMSDEE